MQRLKTKNEEIEIYLIESLSDFETVSLITGFSMRDCEKAWAKRTSYTPHLVIENVPDWLFAWWSDGLLKSYLEKGIDPITDRSVLISKKDWDAQRKQDLMAAIENAIKNGRCAPLFWIEELADIHFREGASLKQFAAIISRLSTPK